MYFKKSSDIPSSEVTPQDVYMNRRSFIAGAGALAGAAFIVPKLDSVVAPSDTVIAGTKLDFSKSSYSTTEKETPLNDITHYNNYYEFSTDKYEPADLAKNFNPRPWTIKVDGLVNKPRTFDIDTLLKMHLEERIYRMRCVEGWSMVIPCIGFPLSSLLSQAEPNSQAKFVQFTSLDDPKRFPGQQRAVLDWPYVEGCLLYTSPSPR